LFEKLTTEFLSRVRLRRINEDSRKCGESDMKRLYLLIALAVAVAAVNAAVFAYYPLSISVQGTTAKVRFALGSNANKGDLAGQTIEVVLEGSYNTKATITVHPTNERTYYKNVLVIENYGVDRTYYGWINVKTAISNQYITSAKLYIKTSPTDPPSAAIAVIDLKSNVVQPTTGSITIPAATQSGTPPNVVITPGRLYIDIEIQIDRNVDASSVTDSATLELIYSPQSAERP